MAFFRSSMVSSIRTISLGYAGITISRTNLMVMTEKSSHIFVRLKAKSQFTDYAQKSWKSIELSELGLPGRKLFFSIYSFL